ncbi:MAG: aminotransferase class IV, partial [Candidatus Omnitrophota bacterium]
VMEMAKKEGIPIKEEMIRPEDLYRADECFLTGTAAELIPVAKIDSYKIGSGKPGEITLRLLERLRKLTRIGGVRY